MPSWLGVGVVGDAAKFHGKRQDDREQRCAFVSGRPHGDGDGDGQTAKCAFVSGRPHGDGDGQTATSNRDATASQRRRGKGDVCCSGKRETRWRERKLPKKP
ncbi:uncharacterized protein G2W53_037285 [Senna tora]|uniref:Uncharacterized protein n=1 Tax=Senna tora TaxID=362788 RepID=A0A834SYY1_9FABA|nr:uncharacterized protein G2W53_037285 [Senna tora]